MISGLRDDDYARRLWVSESAPWKRFFDVQGPYRRHLRALNLGFVLDLGCGVGRNLVNLGGRTAGVGVDRDPEAIRLASGRGLDVFLTSAFAVSAYAVPGRFDSLLVSHVIEHLTFDEGAELVRQHLEYVKPGGRVVFITPQPAGFRSDSTHVLYYDPPKLERLASALRLDRLTLTSYPFPPAVGRLFPYNEWILVASRSR